MRFKKAQPYGCALLLELKQFGFKQGFYRQEGIEDCAGDRGIDLHDSESLDRLGSAAFAAEGEVGDVDALLSEDGSDFSDYTRNVEVAADEEIALKRCFDVDAIEFE